MDREFLKTHTFIGTVEDNNDPRKLGRVRVRVAQVYDEIPTQDIPWAFSHKDLNGNEFNIPDVGKVVSVRFDQGNIYQPEYLYSDHYNINLENKLNTLSGNEYTEMKAIYFDHSTQIFRTPNEGLKLDHEYTNVNLDKNGNILLNIRDNKSIITLGSKDADEEAVLGTTYMEWMDSFIEQLLGDGGGPYLGNAGFQVVPTPSMLNCLNQYQQMRKDFVSKHVRISKNDHIIAQTRPYKNQKGDGINAKTIPSDYTPSSKYWNPVSNSFGEYQSLSAASGNNPADYNPSDYKISTSYDIPTSTLDNSKYQNGKLPKSILSKSKWASGEKYGKWISSQITGTDAAYFMADAARSFDALFDAYEVCQFDGKSKLKITDGYRTYEQQVIVKNKMGSFAATPGISNHGWGIAIDLSGIANPISTLKTNAIDRASAYRTPTYQWLFQNGPKFGIFNPEKLRDGSGKIDEWWHFEYHGKSNDMLIQYSEYAKKFSSYDISVLRRNSVTDFTPPSKLS